MRKLDECDMQDFGRLESSEKTIAILGDRWPQTAKQGGDRISKQFYVIWIKRNESPNVRGVSVRSRGGAPSRKGCVVNGQMTKASNKRARPPSPIPPLLHVPCREGSDLKRTANNKLTNRDMRSIMQPHAPPPPSRLNFKLTQLIPPSCLARDICDLFSIMQILSTLISDRNAIDCLFLRRTMLPFHLVKIVWCIKSIRPSSICLHVYRFIGLTYPSIHASMHTHIHILSAHARYIYSIHSSIYPYISISIHQ